MDENFENFEGPPPSYEEVMREPSDESRYSGNISVAQPRRPPLIQSSLETSAPPMDENFENFEGPPPAFEEVMREQHVYETQATVITIEPEPDRRATVGLRAPEPCNHVTHTGTRRQRFYSFCQALCNFVPEFWRCLKEFLRVLREPSDKCKGRIVGSVCCVFTFVVLYITLF